MQTLAHNVLAIRKLDELISQIRIATLTTISHDGSLRSRPIMTRKNHADGDLWFFLKQKSPAVAEIRRSPGVNLSYAKPFNNTYVSISGTAEVISDHKLFEDLWDPEFQKWFPAGPSDLSLTLFRVSAKRAEYWNRSSPTRSPDPGSVFLSPDQLDDPQFHAELADMSPSEPVIATTGACPSCHTHHARCHHRAFPTTFGCGEAPAEAARDLIRLLCLEQDALVDRWHRQTVERAIADVQAFLEQTL
jgi:general stress protein 26